MLIGAGLAAKDPEPWLGNWNLNLSKSNDARYKRITARIESWRDGLKVTYDMVGNRGGVTHLEWAGKFDGQDYLVEGSDNLLTNAYRRIDDRTYQIVIKDGGIVVATSRVVASADGKTLQVTTESKSSQGQTSRTVAVYERQ